MTEQINEMILTKSSRRRRVAAFLIDHVLFSGLASCFAFLILGPGFMDKRSPGNMFTPVFAVLVPVFFLYVGKDLVNGISPGRWVTGIMVREENDFQKVPPKGRLMLRNLFYIIWPVEFLILALDKDKKRLGDKYAETAVLNNPEKAKRAYRIITLVAIGFIFFAFTMFFAASSIKSSEAYKTAIRQIEADETLKNEIGGIKGYGFLPEGSVSINNGYGQAALEIDVLGNEKDVAVKVYLTKEPNANWQVVEMKK